jgi:hypothetical protein
MFLVVTVVAAVVVVVVVTSVVAMVFVLVTAVVMPVVMVPIVIAVADEFLVIAFAAEVVVHPAVVGVVEIRPGFIDDYLVTVVEIKIAIPGRQVAGKDPTAAILVDELMIRHIIIALDVRDVIIVYMVIAGGAPGGLTADVDGDFDLCGCGLGNGEAE